MAVRSIKKVLNWKKNEFSAKAIPAKISDINEELKLKKGIHFISIKEISKILDNSHSGDIYKGVLVTPSETKIVAKITGKKIYFPATICSVDSDRKIKEAYQVLERKRVKSNRTTAN